MRVVLILLAAALVGLVAGVGLPTRAASTAVSARTFTICRTGGGMDCVADGDTAWMGGTKVRVADVDAPKTHPPHCASEADPGERATRKLAALMSGGSFNMVAPDRDEDRYGRKLRVLSRGGRSFGGDLVASGLARRWEGRRRPWC